MFKTMNIYYHYNYEFSKTFTGVILLFYLSLVTKSYSSPTIADSEYKTRIFKTVDSLPIKFPCTRDLIERFRSINITFYFLPKSCEYHNNFFKYGIIVCNGANFSDYNNLYQNNTNLIEFTCLKFNYRHTFQIDIMNFHDLPNLAVYRNWRSYKLALSNGDKYYYTPADFLRELFFQFQIYDEVNQGLPGIITSLVISESNMKSIINYRLFANIFRSVEVLDFSGNQLTNFCEYRSDSEELVDSYIISDKLKYVYLNNNSLSNILSGRNCFKYLPNIEYLYLQFNMIETINGEILSHLKHLNLLDISMNVITHVEAPFSVDLFSSINYFNIEPDPRVILTPAEIPNDDLESGKYLQLCSISHMFGLPINRSMIGKYLKKEKSKLLVNSCSNREYTPKYNNVQLPHNNNNDNHQFILSTESSNRVSVSHKSPPLAKVPPPVQNTARTTIRNQSRTVSVNNITVTEIITERIFKFTSSQGSSTNGQNRSNNTSNIFDNTTSKNSYINLSSTTYYNSSWQYSSALVDMIKLNLNNEKSTTKIVLHVVYSILIFLSFIFIIVVGSLLLMKLIIVSLQNYNDYLKKRIIPNNRQNNMKNVNSDNRPGNTTTLKGVKTDHEVVDCVNEALYEQSTNLEHDYSEIHNENKRINKGFYVNFKFGHELPSLGGYENVEVKDDTVNLMPNPYESKCVIDEEDCSDDEDEFLSTWSRDKKYKMLEDVSNRNRCLYVNCKDL